MVIHSENSEAGCQLNVLLEEGVGSSEEAHGSEYAYVWDTAWENEFNCDEEIEGSQIGSNLLSPTLVFCDLPALESRLEEKPPSHVMDAWLSNIPTNSQNLISAPSIVHDQYASSSRTEQISDTGQLVDNANSSHYQRRRYHCPECDVDFGLKKDLQRHFETTKAHRSSAIQCHCKQLFSRKDKFYEHVRKRPCDPVVPFFCSCGYRIESSSPDSVGLILEHVKLCGQRKRGRPKK
ncbi:hypothetical protein GGI43DRAFT_403194 [Trichoderma evansii]